MSDQDVDRMFDSLTGLSVGDAFGQSLFSPGAAREHLGNRTLPPSPWHWTDDTHMALSITGLLLEHGTVDQDELAASFGRHFDPTRGYGPGMHLLLPRYRSGADWRHEAGGLFGGEGSYGNGASMRVAPLGAYFSGDPERVVPEAAKSAEVTHSHPEGVAGAIAVAVAAAVAESTLIDDVIGHTPESEVREGLRKAAQLSPDTSLDEVVSLLGNGSRITAQDTVAFCVWVAAHHLDDYPEALWLTASAGGDVDTTCAIVGGIIAPRTGVPREWLARRAPLPNWAPTP